MLVGPVQSAKRALIKVLVALAVVCNVTLVITRESAVAGLAQALQYNPV